MDAPPHVSNESSGKSHLATQQGTSNGALPTVRTAPPSTAATSVHGRSSPANSSTRQPTVARKAHPSGRAVVAKSDGSRNGQLAPLPPQAATAVITNRDVVNRIADLREALYQRQTHRAAPTAGSHTASAASLSDDELYAAKGMLAHMGRRGMSAEELCALTGVNVMPAKAPAPLHPTPPPTQPSQFSGRTKVRALVAPAKLLLGESDGSATSASFTATMTSVEGAVDSHEVAVKRAAASANHMLSLLNAWEALRDGDYDTMADKVMARMLEIAPSLAETPLTCTTHEEALALMGMVGRAVVAFTSPEDTVEVTLEMGAKHHMYGVTEAHYTALRDAFMEELPNFLPASLFHETRPFWMSMWNIIISLLITAVKTERGEAFAKRKHDNWVMIVQKTMAEIVKREMGGPQDERKHPFMMHVYDRGVEIDPAMKRYFLFREVRNSDRSMEAVIRIVSNLDDMAALHSFVEELGILHIEYGLTAEALKTYRQPFLDTCAQYIGDDPELWNTESAKAVGRLWDFLSQKWAIGFNVNKKSMSNANAPESNGQFCLIFTDIEASTKLWEKDRESMCEAVKNHHRIIRALIADFDGYEVKTIGDSFMIACKDALIALKIAVGIQLEFMRTPTTQDFEMIEYPQGMGDASCWRSDAVRVRIGIHYCTHANAVYDPVQRRYDYYGPDVNLAARTEAAACGGQILMTEEAYTSLKSIEKFTTEPRHRLLAGISTTVEKGSDEYMKPLSEYVTFPDLGWRDMKGIADPVHLYGAVPVALTGRVFPAGSDTSMGSSQTSTTMNAMGFANRSSCYIDDDLTNLDDLVIIKPLAPSDADEHNCRRPTIKLNSVA